MVKSTKFNKLTLFIVCTPEIQKLELLKVCRECLDTSKLDDKIHLDY